MNKQANIVDKMWYSHIKNTEKGLMSLFNKIMGDPMMKCFRESEETKSFMVNRMEEIIKEASSQLASESHRHLLVAAK